MIPHQRRAVRHRSQYLRLRKICHAWLAAQIAQGGEDVAAVILTHRADLEDAAGVWAWDLLEAAHERWRDDNPPENFGRWLRQNESDVVAQASLTFLEDQRRLLGLTDILEVR